MDEHGWKRKSLDFAQGAGLALLIPLVLVALTIAMTIVIKMVDTPIDKALVGTLRLLGLSVGLTQLLYIVPASIRAHKCGRSAMVAGMAVGAALVFLLNAGFFLLIIGTINIG